MRDTPDPYDFKNQEAIDWARLATGLCGTAIYTALLCIRSKLSFLVKLQVMFVASYAMLMLHSVCLLIVSNVVDNHKQETWFTTLMQLMFFFISSLYYVGHWRFTWKYWLVS